MNELIQRINEMKSRFKNDAEKFRDNTRAGELLQAASVDLADCLEVINDPDEHDKVVGIIWMSILELEKSIE